MFFFSQVLKILTARKVYLVIAKVWFHLSGIFEPVLWLFQFFLDAISAAPLNLEHKPAGDPQHSYEFHLPYPCTLKCP